MNDGEIKIRVDRMISQVRLVWAILAIGSLSYFFMSDASWWILPALILVLCVGYSLHVATAGIVLISLLDRAGVVERRTESVQIVAQSPQTVGRYYEADVPEWIDVAIDDATHRYVFIDFAPRSGNTFQVPSSGEFVLFAGGIFQPAREGEKDALVS